MRTFSDTVVQLEHKRFARIGMEMLRVVQDTHKRGVLHRDIKVIDYTTCLHILANKAGCRNDLVLHAAA